MTKHRSLVVASLAFVLALALAWPVPAPASTRPPTRCRAADAIRSSGSSVEDFSEPNGYFRSDNLLSNEIWFQYGHSGPADSAPRPGGVYLGVGPEQNFTYIAALKPKMVFITDIRRGNLHTHLMYKALFELSADRAEFVSRLFTKKRPDGAHRRSRPAPS